MSQKYTSGKVPRGALLTPSPCLCRILSESEQEAEISKETTEVVKYADELYLNFLQVYVAFIKNNKQTDPKKCKEIIKSLEDVPKFAKSLEMDDEDILNLLGRFVSEHICQHPDCDGLTVSLT